jgi:hypothetical protein
MRDAIKGSTPQLMQIDGWHLPYGGTPNMSAARCARVSYLNHDGTEPDIAKDFALSEMLLRSRHMSPFEHQARPTPGQRHANLKGWISHRTLIED